MNTSDNPLIYYDFLSHYKDYVCLDYENWFWGNYMKKIGAVSPLKD